MGHYTRTHRSTQPLRAALPSTNCDAPHASSLSPIPVHRRGVGDSQLSSATPYRHSRIRSNTETARSRSKPFSSHTLWTESGKRSGMAPLSARLFYNIALTCTIADLLLCITNQHLVIWSSLLLLLFFHLNALLNFIATVMSLYHLHFRVVLRAAILRRTFLFHDRTHPAGTLSWKAPH